MGARCGARNPEPSVFLVIRISYRLRKPLHHQLFFLMKVREVGKPQNMAEMVWFKADELHKELAALTRRQAWEDILSKVRPELQERTWCEIHRQANRSMCDFVRRIVDRVRSDPCRLLMLGRSEEDVSGAESKEEVRSARRRLATELLATPVADLHITARKVVYLFHLELRETAAKGTVS